MAPKIVVTGANGRLGRALARSLAARGVVDDVVLTTRDPGQVEDLTALGFEVRAADFVEPASMDEAFAGCHTLVLISASGPVAERIVLHRNAVDAAVRAGVGHIIYTSRVAPRASSPYPYAAIHDDTEAYLAAAGIPLTLVRNNEFSENLDPWLATALETGVLEFGAKGPIAFICRADVLAAMTAVILGEGHVGATYELSGPEALDRDGLAAVLAAATGVAVVAADGDVEAFGRVVIAQGRPDFLVEMFKGLFEASAAGEWSTVSSDPARLAGRPATTISAYIREKFGSPRPSSSGRG